MFKFTFAQDFLNSKTTCTAIVAICAALSAWTNHQITPVQATAAIFTALFAAFHRDTVQKGNERASDDRGILIDHAFAAADDRAEQRASPTEGSVIPGFPITVGNLLPFLEAWAAHHSKIIADILKAFGGNTVAAAPAPAALAVVEPVDGEADVPK